MDILEVSAHQLVKNWRVPAWLRMSYFNPYQHTQFLLRFNFFQAFPDSWFCKIQPGLPVYRSSSKHIHPSLNLLYHSKFQIQWSANFLVWIMYELVCIHWCCLWLHTEPDNLSLLCTFHQQLMNICFPVNVNFTSVRQILGKMQGNWKQQFKSEV